MKNIILFILGIMFSTFSYARSVGELNIHDIQIEKKNENLIVNFKVDVPQHLVKSNYKQLLIPVVYNEQQEIDLPAITIIGRIRVKREKQERLLTGNTNAPATVLIAPVGETFSYIISVPYSKWMDTLSLRIEQIEQGCCKEKLLSISTLAEGISLVPKPQPIPITIASNDSIPAHKVKNQLFTLHFRLNQSKIEMAFDDNSNTLKQVSEFIKQNPQTKIEISGYASPEGNKSWNEELANKRAQALENYLIAQGWASDASITIINHSINWQGLQTFMVNSDLPFKTEVLKILNDTSNVELRNQKLRQLQGGIPYQYLVSKVYPKLRVASILITNF